MLICGNLKLTSCFFYFLHSGNKIIHFYCQVGWVNFSKESHYQHFKSSFCAVCSVYCLITEMLPYHYRNYTQSGNSSSMRPARARISNSKLFDLIKSGILSHRRIAQQNFSRHVFLSFRTSNLEILYCINR